MTTTARYVGGYHLTHREEDVARLLLDGSPNKLIARDLCISTRTVKGYVTSILLKTESDNRTQAALRLAGH
jgi:two-component system nitrate/nitrite response regulator NarL